ncbi:hypothetical protein [Nocardia sp. MW-W600-9]
MSDDRSMEDAVSSPNTEITALAQQVATARGKLPLQHDTALYDALSDSEIRAERELAEWIRAQRRKQRRHAVADELAAEKRDRRTGALIRRADEADAHWHRKALAARRRVSSADARLAQLYRRAEWSSRALIGVVVLGMVWAGVNVQHNLVPSGDMSDPLYWLSFGIEAMISIPIITIMVAATTAARWGRELERGKVLLFELALLGTTVALNAGPHLASGSFGRAAEYAIAPVMVGVVIWLHAWVSARYALLIEGASVELPGDASYSPAERVVSRPDVTGAEIAAGRVSVAGMGASSSPSVGTTVQPAVPTSSMEQLETHIDSTPAAATGSGNAVAAPDIAATSATGQVAAGQVVTPHDEALAHDDAQARRTSGPQHSHIPAQADTATRAGEFEQLDRTTSASAPAVHVAADATATTHTTVTAAPDSASAEASSATMAPEPDATSPAPVAMSTSMGVPGVDSDVRAVASTSQDDAPEQTAAQASTESAPVTGRGRLTDGTRRPSTDKLAAPGTLELIHKAAAEHRRNGDHARVNGAAPTLRRIPVTAAAQATAGEATGTDPVPEATAHAGTVARDRNGDTAAPTESVVVHNDPQAPADEPEQLTLATEIEPAQPQHAASASAQLTNPEPVIASEQQLTHAATTSDTEQQRTNSATAPAAKRPLTNAASTSAPKQQLAQSESLAGTEPESEPPSLPKKQPTKAEEVALASERVPVESPEPIEPDLADEDDLADDAYNFDDDTEVRALARQIAHRSPLRLTLDQIEEILELTDQSWSARSIGAEVGVSGTTVTNIVEFARKIRHPYAFTG